MLPGDKTHNINICDPDRIHHYWLIDLIWIGPRSEKGVHSVDRINVHYIGCSLSRGVVQTRYIIGIY